MTLTFVGMLVLTGLAIVGAIWLTHTQTAQFGNAKQRCQDAAVTVHRVTIEHDTVTPAHTAARRCDKLIITNLDSKPRLLAFGRHEDHISYDGVSERVVPQGQSLQITLITTGTYLFHDHDEATITGTFTVVANPTK
jgi:hypothetical protein